MVAQALNAAAPGRGARGGLTQPPEEPMRVLVLGSYAAALINFRAQLIGEMVAAGHEVIACAPGWHAATADALAALGARYRAIALSRTGLNPTADIRDLIGLIRLFREVRPDLILVYTAKPVIYGGLAAAIAGVPHRFALITGLGYAFTEGHEWRRRALRRVSRLLYRVGLARADGIFFQNPDDLADFRRLGIIRDEQKLIMVNGSGVDTDRFAYCPLLKAGPANFLLIARLVRDKGILDYVKAARHLKARFPEARFRLLGPLDDNPAAIRRDELQSWQSEGVIEYLGRADDVRPYLRQCTAYVLPSFYREGVPRTILEAMAIGRAVITTDMPGCRETVVPDENGFLVPPHQPAALAAAMERLIVDPELAVVMGEKSRALAEARFDVRKVNAVMLHAMGLR